MIEATCNKCQATITPHRIYIAGCLCDPDSPSWIGFQPDGKLIIMSHANYTKKES